MQTAPQVVMPWAEHERATSSRLKSLGEVLVAVATNAVRLRTRNLYIVVDSKGTSGCKGLEMITSINLRKSWVILRRYCDYYEVDGRILI
jgi:hypothetical protein